MGILQQIVSYKKRHVAALYEQYNLPDLQAKVQMSSKHFYTAIDALNEDNKFLIAEFKRRSPSAGVINETVDLKAQIKAYLKAEVSAISVLTDEQFFGGSYADLKETAGLCANTPTLVLNKEFIIDPIQVYLARVNGANMILLIAAILNKTTLKALKALAESLGMGVLVEVHNEAECGKVADLNCKVIGINNRDLDTFSVALNTTNYLKSYVNAKHIIGESGVYNKLDINVLRESVKGFLIGTSLMQGGKAKMLKSAKKELFFKACGLRTLNDLEKVESDLIGINFSKLSKRKIVENQLNSYQFKGNEVAVFYRNSIAEIKAILTNHPFSYAQLYANDLAKNDLSKLLSSLKCKKILAIKVDANFDYRQYESLIRKSDLVILDGAVPGSGNCIDDDLIPADFPYPFLLAGGMNLDNLDRILTHKKCIGVDVASGIEREGEVSIKKVNEIKKKIEDLMALVVS